MKVHVPSSPSLVLTFSLGRKLAGPDRRLSALEGERERARECDLSGFRTGSTRNSNLCVTSIWASFLFIRLRAFCLTPFVLQLVLFLVPLFWLIGFPAICFCALQVLVCFVLLSAFCILFHLLLLCSVLPCPLPAEFAMSFLLAFCYFGFCCFLLLSAFAVALLLSVLFIVLSALCCICLRNASKRHRLLGGRV